MRKTTTWFFAALMFLIANAVAGIKFWAYNGSQFSRLGTTFNGTLTFRF